MVVVESSGVVCALSAGATAIEASRQSAMAHRLNFNFMVFMEVSFLGRFRTFFGRETW